jgi:hypothetical protein
VILTSSGDPAARLSPLLAGGQDRLNDRENRFARRHSSGGLKLIADDVCVVRRIDFRDQFLAPSPFVSTTVVSMATGMSLLLFFLAKAMPTLPRVNPTNISLNVFSGLRTTNIAPGISDG